jgi:hypothetical protein
MNFTLCLRKGNNRILFTKLIGDSEKELVYLTAMICDQAWNLVALPRSGPITSVAGRALLLLELGEQRPLGLEHDPQIGSPAFFRHRPHRTPR